MTIEKVEDTPLTPEAVRNYLRSNPEFFLENAELLNTLKVPHQSGGAISLLEHQVHVLRDRNKEFHTRLDRLLEHARDNDHKFQQTRRFVLGALESQDLAELSDTVERSLYDDFGVEACSLILFSETPIDGCRAERVIDANRYVGTILTSQKAICGEFPAAEMNWLFQRNGIRSAAIAPLQQLQLLGVLAVGHSDPNFYRSGMGTLFLNYVSEVLQRLIPELANRRA
ncbi:MAG: DUF484 family protein [Pseudomonadales bacterium]|jgi:uncharacterized protein YigA (DUF484 family)